MFNCQYKLTNSPSLQNQEPKKKSRRKTQTKTTPYPVYSHKWSMRRVVYTQTLPLPYEGRKPVPINPQLKKSIITIV